MKKIQSHELKLLSARVGLWLGMALVSGTSVLGCLKNLRKIEKDKFLLLLLYNIFLKLLD